MQCAQYNKFITCLGELPKVAHKCIRKINSCLTQRLNRNNNFISNDHISH